MLNSIWDRTPGETRFAFVSGKGGVGKTTVAAAMGIRLAQEGRRTLLVSTDIQRSLDDVLGQGIGFEETPIAGRPNLFAVNVDPAESIRKNRERIIKTLEALDPESIVLGHMKVDEKTDCGAAHAAVFEMNRYLSSSDYDAIIFDTAPTGIHLEKMLSQSNSAISLAKQYAERRAAVEAAEDDTAEAALDALQALLDSDKAALAVLASERTSFYLVTLPEAMPLAEVERSLPMLEGGFGVRVRGIVINEVIPEAERESSAFWRARGRMQDGYVEQTKRLFPTKEIAVSYLVPEVDGVGRLERIGDGLFGIDAGSAGEQENALTLEDLVRPEPGKTSFVFFSGKGGVGKTTVSAATAVWLAESGYRTLIVSTDLQRSLDDVFQQRIEEHPTPVHGHERLFAVTLDPVSSMQKYRGKILDTLGLIDPDSIMLKQMRADAGTDCGCAQAALFELNQYLRSNEYDVVVFDTAPLGAHLEKLAAQNSYAVSLARSYEMQAELAKALGDATLAQRVEDLRQVKERDEASIEILRSDRTRYVLIMIPENMPFQEARRNAQILEDSHRIPVRGIVVNQVIPNGERHRTDFWHTRSNMQDRYLALAEQTFKPRPIGKVPLLQAEAVGVGELEKVGRELYGAIAGAGGVP